MLTLALMLAVGAVRDGDPGTGGEKAPTPTPTPTVEEVQPVDVRAGGAAELLLTYIGAWIARSHANPDNANYAVPSHTAFASLRPRLRLTLGPRWEFIVRPRLSVRLTQAFVAGAPEPERLVLTPDTVELYSTWRATDALMLSYGQQRFLWGPADLMSPSNPIFPEVYFAKTPVTLYRGRWLARVSASLSRNLTADVLVETHDNGDPAFLADVPFERKLLVRLQYAPGTGASRVGVVAGKGMESRLWLGEYAVGSITRALSFYVDALHQRGAGAWYPTERDGALAFERRQLDSARVFTLAVLGVRYAFTDDSDVRLESAYHQAGYAPDELRRAIHAVQLAPGDDAVLNPYASPGLMLPGRAYLYVTALLRHLGPGGHLTLQPRYLCSLEDGSGNALLNAEWAVLPSWKVYLSAGVTHGADDLELTRRQRGLLVVATKFIW